MVIGYPLCFVVEAIIGLGTAVVRFGAYSPLPVVLPQIPGASRFNLEACSVAVEAQTKACAGESRILVILDLHFTHVPEATVSSNLRFLHVVHNNIMGDLDTCFVPCMKKVTKEKKKKGTLMCLIHGYMLGF